MPKYSMAALFHLDARIIDSPAHAEAKRLQFLCPGCCQRRLVVDYWDGPPEEIRTENGHVYNLWHCTVGADDLDQITLSSAVSYGHGTTTGHPCEGWVGRIRAGEVVSDS